MIRPPHPATTPEPDVPTRDEAIASAAAVFAQARRTRDELYATGGAQAVAEAAYVPGGPSIPELAEGFERLAQRSREKRKASAA